MAKKNNGLKEAFRQFLVTLKRQPQLIPLCAFIITFLVYSLHLTYISNTTAKIAGRGMGLCGFATMLFSMLSIVCFMNAFQVRKPVNKPMLVLMLVMVAIIAFADWNYLNKIYEAVIGPQASIKVDMSTVYIAYAEYYLRMHILCLGISVVLTLLLPVYSKAIRKIKTSVEVEDNGEMGAIDISG